MLLGRFIKGVSSMIAPTDENIDDMVAAYKKGFRAGYRSEDKEAQRLAELQAILFELKQRLGGFRCVTGLAPCRVCVWCRASAALEKP